MVNVGVVGYGYWGPNIVRNFNSVEGCRVVSICDRDSGMLAKAARMAPNATTVSDSNSVINDPRVDAVAIVTPVSTHYKLACEALNAGKHVFIEKPLTSTVAQAEHLVELAETKKLKLMVDHTFIFTAAVAKIKQIADEKLLGDIYYYDSIRVNLGLFQHDINVIWDLAPHDFSIMLHVLDEKPLAVSAGGIAHINGTEDVAYVTVYLPNNIIAHFNVNWLSPVKVRNTMISGKKRMLVWNDIVADDKIKVYDKGVLLSDTPDIHSLLVSYRSGDMWAPRLEQSEALTLECKHFVESVVSDTKLRNDGQDGLEVVRLLEACDRSIALKSAIVEL